MRDDVLTEKSIDFATRVMKLYSFLIQDFIAIKLPLSFILAHLTHFDMCFHFHSVQILSIFPFDLFFDPYII